jgi:hypothetical protein
LSSVDIGNQKSSQGTSLLTLRDTGDGIATVKQPRHKELFGKLRSQTGRLAKTRTFSLYPEHFGVLKQRGLELNISHSILLQLLLEIEQRDGILRRELIARLTPPPQATEGVPQKA